MRGRLLDQLEQRVERLLGELMRLVEDVDLHPPLDRLQHHALADLADVVDSALARRVHLDDVERRPRRDRPARVANAARLRRRPLLAVEALRDDAGQRRLARPARAGKEVRLPHLPALDRVAKRARRPLLADHLVEVLRPVLAVERGHESLSLSPVAHLPSSASTGAVPASLARARLVHGAWETLLSAASSRT